MSKRAAILLPLAGLALLYAALVLPRLPATLLTSQLEQQNPDLRFDNVSGTLWQGHATNASYMQQQLGAMEWSLAPQQLFAGRWMNRVSIGGTNFLHGNGLVGKTLMGGTRLEGLTAQLELADLPMQLRNQIGLPLSGTLDVALDAFQLDRESAVQALNGSLQLTSLTVNGLPVGDFQAQLSLVESGDVQLDFSPHSDEGLGAEGQLVVQPDGNATLAMQLTRLEILGESNARVLKLLTRAQGDKQIFSWRGNLRAYF